MLAMDLRGKGGFVAVAATGLLTSIIVYWLRSQQSETALTAKTKARLSPGPDAAGPEPQTEA